MPTKGKEKQLSPPIGKHKTNEDVLNDERLITKTHSVCDGIPNGIHNRQVETKKGPSTP